MPLLEQYRLSCPSIMTTHICVCSENFIALPLYKRGNIAVWNINYTLDEPIILIGHHKIVRALALSHPPINHYLCTCSSDNIILWDLLQNDGKPTKGRILHSDMEQPFYCQFSPDNLKIAISFSSGIWVFDLKENVWYASNEGIHFVQFIYNVKNNDILGVEENILKNWDLEANEVGTKVSITSGFPSALCIHEKNEMIFVGSTCGHINVYDRNFNALRTVQVWRLLAQYLKLESTEDGSYGGSDSFPIHSLEIIELEDINTSNYCLPDVIYLLVVTSTCLFLLNFNNEEIIFFQNFNDNSDLIEKSLNIGLVRSSSVFYNADKSTIYVSLIPVLGESLLFLKIFVREIVLHSVNRSVEKSTSNEKIALESQSGQPYLTFINNGLSITGESLLAPRKQAFVKKKHSRKGACKLNLPITFHTNIKSSGYGTLNKSTTLFHPQINKPRKAQSHLSVSVQNLKITTATKKRNIFEIYEKQADYKQLELQSKLQSFENPTISSLQITADGHYASCTSSEGLVDILDLEKKNIKIINTLQAHKSEVTAAKWSHSGKLVVTSGKDKMVKVWNFEKKYPLLTIGIDEDNIKNRTKHKFIFEDAVEQVQFYYLDRFILTASGNKVYLFDYIIENDDSGPKRFPNKTSLKLIKGIPLDMKRITTIAAMNQFCSNLVICSGSSKCIDVIDMDVGKIIYSINEPCARSPHVISLNEGSPYTTQEPGMYDLFLTASLFDGIKIWDLRTNKCVICYKEHKCRSLPCDAVFSPCGKYSATGSEDKSVYIYDLRKLTSMCKLSDQQVDAFISVAFSRNSQLLASSLNGLLCFYGAA